MWPPGLKQILACYKSLIMNRSEYNCCYFASITVAYFLIALGNKESCILLPKAWNKPPRYYVFYLLNINKIWYFKNIFFNWKYFLVPNNNALSITNNVEFGLAINLLWNILQKLWANLILQSPRGSKKKKEKNESKTFLKLHQKFWKNTQSN